MPIVEDLDLGPERTLVDRYLLRREIARGGIGCVFEALDVRRGTSVALKVLTRASAARASARERFIREAQALALSRHPNVVDVLDAGVDASGHPFIVMELLVGETLHGVIQRYQTIPLAMVAALARQLCSALSFAHGHGIVHRDIKPNNMLVVASPEGDVLKVIDFGVASMRADLWDTKRVTRDGSVVGTPEYMAPEQLLGDTSFDPRIDVYAAAATLFECASGALPITGNFSELIRRAQGPTFRVSREVRQALGARVADVFERGLARERGLRYADPGAFAEALTKAIDLPLVALRLLGPSPLEQESAVWMGAATGQSRSHHAERRREPRVAVRIPVTVLHPHGAYASTLSELSEHGAAIDAEERWEMGDVVLLRFALSLGNASTWPDVTVSARVVWVEERDDGRVAGLTLEKVSALVRTLLANAVAGRQSPD